MIATSRNRSIPISTEPAQAEPVILRIDRLGQDGDGIARQSGAPLHVRYALGGESVLARPIGRTRAIATRVLEASPQRVEPPCPLFGRCGGCVLQHLDRNAALDWKTGLVRAALEQAGFGWPDRVAAHQSPPRTRRRMDLAVRREAGGAVVVGLHERGSERVVGLDTCHVLDPVLFALIAPLAATLNRLQALKRAGSVIVNLLDSGPDLLLATDAALATRDRQILAEFALAHAVPRIAWRGEAAATDRPEIVSLQSPVRHVFSGAAVSPPPGSFLQATRAGEAAIVEAVLAGLPGRMPRSARVVELYAGCGTIGLALSERARIVAFEGQESAAAALKAAGSSRRIESVARDLNRQPLLARDLAGAAAIVLDPPHDGAGAQMREIAGSLVPCIVYVSCNPAALSADSRMLAAAGYRLERVTVVDQFLWSARTESVCVFTRTAVTRRGPMPRPPR